MNGGGQDWLAGWLARPVSQSICFCVSKQDSLKVAASKAPGCTWCHVFGGCYKGSIDGWKGRVGSESYLGLQASEAS